jgi:hypothetical protein
MQCTPIKGPSRPSLRFFFLSTFLLMAPVALTAQFPVEDPADACSLSHLKDAARVGDYLFRTYEDKATGERCFQVFHGGKVIFRRTNDNGGWFTIGQPARKEDNVPAIPNGTDVTGRGRPNMIVAAYTGGAHCCSVHYVFELEPEFKLLETLNDQDDDVAHFEKVGNKYLYKTTDWTFAYWPSCFACSPSEPVLLQFEENGNVNGFHLALDKMQKPAPTEEEWNAQLSAARKVVHDQDVGSVGRTLWSTVLDLIYSGHSDVQGGQFADIGLEAFCMVLKSSPYWADLEPTLHDTPPTCANAKPRRK